MKTLRQQLCARRRARKSRPTLDEMLQNSRRRALDHTELCDNIDWLYVLGGKPTTEAGQSLLREHQADCQWCSRPHRFTGLIDIMLNRTTEMEASAEQIFGPINWD